MTNKEKTNIKNKVNKCIKKYNLKSLKSLEIEDKLNEAYHDKIISLEDHNNPYFFYCVFKALGLKDQATYYKKVYKSNSHAWTFLR